jgi:hypothetical protein
VNALYRVDASSVPPQPASVPLFSLHVRQGKFSDAGVETVFEDELSAQKNALAVFADLARDIVVDSTDFDWQMDVRNDVGRAIYRLRFSTAFSWIENDPEPIESNAGPTHLLG